ncbi:MAG TPA: STAS domain-containing protein [Candidatus Dormibacteraeota bacterium]|nr:STAS domain-containing protein [Candidatus Dormibacteraeota bacterium]
MGSIGGMLFEMHWDHDADGVLRLSLIGELDLAAAPALQERLRSLKDEGAAVRLDLSRLEFADSSGLRTLISSAEAAQRDGWQLEVDRSVLPQVQRVIDLIGASPYLWPSRETVAQGA